MNYGPVWMPGGSLPPRGRLEEAGTVLHWVGVAMLVASVVGSARAAPQEPRTQMVSVSSSGTPANAYSYRPCISDDGLYVGFASSASNLDPGDPDNLFDVYVYHRQTKQTELVSVSTAGVKGDDDSFAEARGLSADGRFVAFYSFASNLVVGDTNGVEDVYLRDRRTGQTFRISMGLGGAEPYAPSRIASVTADGRYVAYRGEADNIVLGDTNGSSDIFVHDRVTGQTIRVSVRSDGSQSKGQSTDCSISSDGTAVVFASGADDLVLGDTNNSTDIFVHDLVTAQTSRVSVSSSGAQANNQSNQPSISADGRYVAFQSQASNLVVGDPNHTDDVFVHDRQSGTTILVSVNSQGLQGNYPSYWPSMSPEGRYVAFTSLATNLIPGNGGWDCYLHDLLTGETKILSVDSSGGFGTASIVAVRPACATDGRVVAFSGSGPLVPGPYFNYSHNYTHTQEGCPFPVHYCQPSQTSLGGCEMTLATAFAPQASSPGDFSFWAELPGGDNLGLAIVGATAPLAQPMGTLGGMLCVRPPFYRLPPKSGGGLAGYCAGYLEYTLADVAGATPLVVPGTELFAQLWARDPANPDGFALSDAVRFTVCP